MGAQELRTGIVEPEAGSNPVDIADAMTNEMLLDALAARLNGPRAAKHSMTMQWNFAEGTDTIGAVNERRFVEISHGAMSHIALGPEDHWPADVTITLTRYFVELLLRGELNLGEILKTKAVAIEGQRTKLIRFFSLLEDDDKMFPIVTPRSDAKAAWDGRSCAAQEASEEQTLRRRWRFALELTRGC